MSSNAVFAGSFDPPTLGHVSIVGRGLEVFSEIHVLVANNVAKPGFLSAEVRAELWKKIAEEKWGGERVKVHAFEGIVADYCRDNGVQSLLRGLRNEADFSYESQIARVNETLNSDLKTFFVLADLEHSAVSSSIVRELAQLGHDVSKFVPNCVVEALRQKLK